MKKDVMSVMERAPSNLFLSDVFLQISEEYLGNNHWFQVAS